MQVTLPEHIDWAAEGVWDEFRAAYNKHLCRGQLFENDSFVFKGIRFVPSFAKLLLDTFGNRGEVL